MNLPGTEQHRQMPEDRPQATRRTLCRQCRHCAARLRELQSCARRNAKLYGEMRRAAIEIDFVSAALDAGEFRDTPAEQQVVAHVPSLRVLEHTTKPAAQQHPT